MTVTTHLPAGLTGPRPQPRPETRSRRHDAAFWVSLPVAVLGLAVVLTAAVLPVARRLLA
jgi:hypothetical protein